MLVTLGNQRGNIAFSMALSIVGIMAGITMATLAYTDAMGARLDFDKMQQFLFLRSEAMRGKVIVEKLDYDGSELTLPIKTAQIVSSHSRNTYTMKTKISHRNATAGGVVYITDGFSIKTLTTTNRGISLSSQWLRNNSMVRSYAEKDITRTSFAGYHYFTDDDKSMNDTPVYFWGPDVVYGKVHSNTDIWVRNGGGGDNHGWPTFYGVVTTSKEIRSTSGIPPYNQIFRAGYFEHYGKLDFPAEATEIRERNNVIDTPADSNHILFVTVNGTNYKSLIGEIRDLGADTADVWQNYPPASGQYLYRNRFAKRDTLWVSGPSGYVSNTSVYVKSKLWLKGTFAGKQTWCSADTLYLVGDCLLSGTSKGQPPDGGIDGNLPMNHTDYLGIVSEKSIIIKYGYKDTSSGLRVKPNCGSDAEGIWIYAALCATGDGHGDSHKDGIFTFEYQHPHPSTPDQYLNSVLYTKIDLHKYKYPQTQSHPWPSDIDYPWYNPLWPESFGYMERGSIHLYGSVAQRIRGFVHRNVYDGEHPNPNGIWNIPEDFCGATSYPSGEAYNAPGATGSGVGYKKDYHFDNRFSFTTPPDFPQVHVKGGLTPFDSQSWVLRKPPMDI